MKTRNKIEYLPGTRIPLIWKRKNGYLLQDVAEIKRLVKRVAIHARLYGTDREAYHEYCRGLNGGDGYNIGLFFPEYPNCGFFFYPKTRRWPRQRAADWTRGNPHTYEVVEFENIRRVEVWLFNGWETLGDEYSVHKANMHRPSMW